MEKDNIKIILIDRHQLFREGVRRVLESETTFKVLACSDNYAVVPSLMANFESDLLLIDIKTFILNKETLGEDILSKYPGFKVIVLASEGEENHVTEAVKVGVHGYLLKEMDIYSFINAIKAIINGISYIHPIITQDLVADYRRLHLNRFGNVNKAINVARPIHLYTKRECEVLQLLTNGQSNRKISETLAISEKTVKNHVSNLFKKMKVNDRTQAVVTAIKNDWVEI